MNLSQWREIQLPKVTRDSLIPRGSVVLNQKWYGPTWSSEFVCDGIRCRVSVTLETMDFGYEARDVKCP